VKTIFITGATGFLGRHFVEQAVENGLKVIASARRSSNISWLKKLNIPIVFLSLSKPEKLVIELFSVVEEYGAIDVVIHNAGITQSLKAADYYEVNYELTKNLIVALTGMSGPLPKFIFTSSIAALGPGNPFTFSPICEDDNPLPVTHYGKSKLKAEQFIMSQQKLPWIIIRPTIIYGPREKNFFNMIKTVNNGFELYVGSRKQMLSFIYVKDLAKVLLKLSDSIISQESYNISDGNTYSAKNVNQIISLVLNKKTKSIVFPSWGVCIIAFFNEIIGWFTGTAPILNCDKVNEMKQLNWLCDNSKIKNELGFSAKYNLNNGIIETINWYKKNGWL